jgi:hypothetical protein
MKVFEELPSFPLNTEDPLWPVVRFSVDGERLALAASAACEANEATAHSISTAVILGRNDVTAVDIVFMPLPLN